jgi:hypothetical protein
MANEYTSSKLCWGKPNLAGAGHFVYRVHRRSALSVVLHMLADAEKAVAKDWGIMGTSTD